MASLNFPKIRFARGEVLFREGDQADRMYLINSGQIEIYQESMGKRVAILEPGEAFGEQALIMESVRLSSARALSETECTIISPEKLREELHISQNFLRPGVEALLLQLSMQNELTTRVALKQPAIFSASPKISKLAAENSEMLAEDFLNCDEASGLPTRESLLLRLIAGGQLSEIGFGEGQSIMLPGSYPTEAYVVIKGTVNYAVPELGGCYLGPGGVIGLAEGVANAQARNKAIAATQVSTLRLPIVGFLSALKMANPGIRGVARITTQRILNTEVSL